VRASSSLQKGEDGPAHDKERTMRVLVIIKANSDSENGKMPSERLVSEMIKFNEELIAKGIMQAGEGLHPSSKGKRVRFSASTGKATVVDGPFAETKELVAGFWIWKVKDIDEAVEWVKRIPNPDKEGPDGEVEIRPIFDSEDFVETLSPDVRAQEEALREKLSQRS
jgi:hypothetical protein